MQFLKISEPIHLCTFNNGEYIKDHIDWLNEYLFKYFAKITISKNPKKGVHNFFFENFENESTKKILKNSDNLSYSIIITEYLKIKKNQIFFCNTEIGKKNNYVSNSTFRFFNFLKVATKAKCLIFLAGHQNTEEYKKIFPFIPTISITGYPKEYVSKIKKKYDYCFFGNINSYRKKKLGLLSGNVYSSFSEKFNKKTKIIKQSILNINIPFGEEWPYISNLRIYSAAKYGILTLNFPSKQQFALKHWLNHYLINNQKLKKIKFKQAFVKKCKIKNYSEIKKFNNVIRNNANNKLYLNNKFFYLKNNCWFHNKKIINMEKYIFFNQKFCFLKNFFVFINYKTSLFLRKIKFDLKKIVKY